jgi:myo-inositol-1(or 4)-monophosphatase
MTESNYQDALELGRRAVLLAEKEIMPFFQSDIQVDLKRDNTPVTAADKKAEAVMRALLEKETPNYGIIGEEFGEKPGALPRQWVIDPIDGTKSFIHGVPLFGTLLALLENGEPVVGIINMPALSDMMEAVTGAGCFSGGRQCRVSGIRSLSQACLLDGSVTTMEKKGFKEPWRDLRHKAGLARGWGDCYGYFLVASGRAEVMVDPIVEIWDIAAPALCVREAGGSFTSLGGSQSLVEKSGIASNGHLHTQMLEAMEPFLNV